MLLLYTAPSEDATDLTRILNALVTSAFDDV